MTPAEWGKPIDVDEKWIHFVDENVKASKSNSASPTSRHPERNQNSHGARLLRISVLMEPAIGRGLPRSRLTWLMVPRAPIFSK
jgi:hypothetical protein